MSGCRAVNTHGSARNMGKGSKNEALKSQPQSDCGQPLESIMLRTLDTTGNAKLLRVAEY